MASDNSFLLFFLGNNDDNPYAAAPSKEGPVNVGDVYYRTATFISMLSFVMFGAIAMESKSDAPYLMGDHVMLGLLIVPSLVMAFTAAYTWRAAKHPTIDESRSIVNMAPFLYGLVALGLFAAVAYACAEGDPTGWKEFVGFSGIYGAVGALGGLAAHSAYRLRKDNPQAKGL